MSNNNKSLDCLLFSFRACIVWDAFFFFFFLLYSDTLSIWISKRKCSRSYAAVKFIMTHREKGISAHKSWSCNTIPARKHLRGPSKHLAHTTDGQILMLAQIRLNHKRQSFNEYIASTMNGVPGKVCLNSLDSSPSLNNITIIHCYHG